MISKYLAIVLSLLSRAISYVPALIYGYIYSEFFTKATYRIIGERVKESKDTQNVLDIGTATGHPLHSIIDCFRGVNVVGIDINASYIKSCKKLFANYSNVDIREMNFYNLEANFSGTVFDVIIFGSSFMLMPDQTKAIELAKRKLSPHGKIYFLLTLYSKKTLLTRLMEVAKPYLKYLSTVDFGKATYKHEFQAFLEEHSLHPTLKDRCTGNFFLKYFTFYIYEVQKMPMNSQRLPVTELGQA